MIKLIYSPKAKSDLNNIFDYIASDNIAEAINFTEHIKSDIERLVDFPNTGTDQGKEFLIQRKIKFIVINDYLAFFKYHAENQTIHILRILNGAMEYETRISEDDHKVK
ncbi:type II toxin-antitoxin system RelE/ParE family toxin [Pumilibacter intestinalis]|uniref:type II toxin-antitoxin system RelE/ParE family toxin n=1 Tax=Pumilibacter intestinalis TaxID=2941511 RepID=UPI003B84556B|nr:type II toxin-antitoxin system RelE/ParE family toxin [Clostridia bacterium]